MKKTLASLLFIFLCFPYILANKPFEITVLQWNIWQEGTTIPGGYDAIVDEIVRLKPDFVTFSEVRNYKQTRFNERLVASLRAKGEEYYSFYSYDSGLLSRYPILDSMTVYPEKDDHGSIYKLTAQVNERKISVYTGHLDYLNCAYYNVRGYDGSSWKEIPKPQTVKEVLDVNTASLRDDAILAFITEAKRDLAEGNCVIIGGDFNEPSHLDWNKKMRNRYDHNGMVIPWTVSTALSAAGYKDAYRVVWPNPVTHPGFTYPSDNELAEVKKLTWAPKADERDRIDFIYYRGKGMKAIDAKVYGPASSIVRSQRVAEVSKDPFLLPAGVWPTDHKGVWVKFRIK
ncbi:MAG: endonuclease/exonuclease/phosphatase family protein [Bacteroidales bacterium]